MSESAVTEVGPEKILFSQDELKEQVQILDAKAFSEVRKELMALSDEKVEQILGYLDAQGHLEKSDQYESLLDVEVDEVSEDTHLHDEAGSERKEEAEEKGLLEKLEDAGDILEKGEKKYIVELEKRKNKGEEGLWSEAFAFMSAYGGAIRDFLKDLFGFDGDVEESAPSSESASEAWSVPESYEGAPVLSRGCAIRLKDGVRPALRVTSSHGARISPLGEANKKEYHAGIDIAASEKSKIEGAELIATEQIEVKKSSDGHGVIAKIAGQEFSYYHVTPEDFLTTSYQSISAGKLFAKVSGRDSKSTAPHIHFSVSGNKKMNPDFAMPPSLRSAHQEKFQSMQARITSAEAQNGGPLAVTTRKGHQDDASLLS